MLELPTYLLLLLLLPLTTPLTCYSCYTFTTDYPEFEDYLPPLLQELTPTTCNHGNTLTCASNQTCIYTKIGLVYGEATASVTSMGCASVRRYLNCVDMENRFYHPYFDLDTCELDRCSLDKCNDGGVQMLSRAGLLNQSQLILVSSVILCLSSWLLVS